MEPRAVEPMTLIAGKYRVERVLGTGGMGVVVAARHEQLDERVAIKLLKPERLAQREAVERALRARPSRSRAITWCGCSTSARSTTARRTS